MQRGPAFGMSQSRHNSPSTASLGSFSRDSSTAPGTLLSPVITTGQHRLQGPFAPPTVQATDNARPMQPVRRSPSPLHQNAQYDQTLYLPSPQRLLKRDISSVGLGIEGDAAELDDAKRQRFA